jgi:ribosomal RNA-processing protein 9
LRGWKVEANSHLVFRGHKAPIDVARVLTDDTFVSGSQDGRLSLWKETRKLPVSTIENCHGIDKFGNANWITAVSTIKSSDLIASGSWDGSLKLWSAKEEKLTSLASIPVQGCINSIELSKNLIVAGCGREHKLGRWVNAKGLKNRITVIKLDTINK